MSQDRTSRGAVVAKLSPAQVDAIKGILANAEPWCPKCGVCHRRAARDA